jgi:hypothetical protein
MDDLEALSVGNVGSPTRTRTSFSGLSTNTIEAERLVLRVAMMRSKAVEISIPDTSRLEGPANYQV